MQIKKRTNYLLILPRIVKKGRILSKSQLIRPEQPYKVVDPAEWRLEVERVTPLLKVKINNENKDWRLHLQQIEHHQKVSNIGN
jgi:hypothetical protein